MRAEGCGVLGPIPQDSGVGLGARKPGVLGGPRDPAPSSFKAGQEGEACIHTWAQAGLGNLGGRKGSWFPLPRETSEEGLGRAGPKG